MEIASRTPEGSRGRCPVCGAHVVIEPSRPPGDAPCPSCGHLLWFAPVAPTVRLVCQRMENTSPDAVEFEAERWRIGSMRARAAQAIDLIRRGILLGLPEAEVIGLLGEPDERGNTWVGYALWRGVRVTYRGSPHRLRVVFAAGGGVCEASVVEV
jgi:hypothetical protein